MVLKAGVEQVRVGEDLINCVLVEQLVWPRAAGNPFFWSMVTHSLGVLPRF